MQVWLTPSEAGRTPQYGSTSHPPDARRDCLLRVLAGRGAGPGWRGARDSLPQAGTRLRADVNVYVSEPSGGTAFELRLGAGRQLYAVCLEGAARVAGSELAEGDALEVQAPAGEDFPLALAALPGGAHLLLIEMARQGDE